MGNVKLVLIVDDIDDFYLIPNSMNLSATDYLLRLVSRRLAEQVIETSAD